MSNEWVMVPRDPTEAMFSASSFQEWDTFEQEWRAMLYAAPAAPQQAEPVVYRKYLDGVDAHVYRLVPRDDEADKWEPLYLHPPAAEVQRLRDALKPFAAIDLTTNQAVDAMDVLRARRALEGK